MNLNIDKHIQAGINCAQVLDESEIFVRISGIGIKAIFEWN